MLIIWGKSLPGRGNSQCESTEVGSKNRKEAYVAGVGSNRRWSQSIKRSLQHGDTGDHYEDGGSCAGSNLGFRGSFWLPWWGETLVRQGGQLRGYCNHLRERCWWLRCGGSSGGSKKLSHSSCVLKGELTGLLTAQTWVWEKEKNLGWLRAFHLSNWKNEGAIYQDGEMVARGQVLGGVSGTQI